MQLFFFFFNDTATTEIYTLSLHDALPILVSYVAPRKSSVPKNRSIQTQRERCRPRASRLYRPVLRDRTLRSEEHTSELQSPDHLVCRLLLEKKKQTSSKLRVVHITRTLHA